MRIDDRLLYTIIRHGGQPGNNDMSPDAVLLLALDLSEARAALRECHTDTDSLAYSARLRRLKSINKIVERI